MLWNVSAFNFWGEAMISLPDVYRNGPRAIRDKATANRVVAILDDHGWLIRVEGGATVAGQHRRDAWKIVRHRSAMPTISAP